MTSASKLRRIGILAFVLMLALQPAAAGALAATGTSTSGAGDTTSLAVSPDCDPKDSGELAADLLLGRLDEGAQLAQNAFDGGSILEANRDNGCYSKGQVANITHVATEQGGLLGRDMMNSSVTAYENHVDGLETVVHQEVNADIDYAMRNNLTLAEAKDRINSTLEDAYVKRQKNLIETVNSSVANAAFLISRARNTSGENADEFLLYNDQDSGTSEWTELAGFGDWTDNNLRTTTVTLANGNQTTVLYLVRRSTYHSPINNSANKTIVYPYQGEGAPSNATGMGWAVTSAANWTHDGGTTSQYGTSLPADATIFLAEQRYHDQWVALQQQHDRVQDNAMQLVEGVYSEYNYSEWTAAVAVDALGPSFLAQEYATNRNTTGYYTWGASQLGLLGDVGSNVNASFGVAYTPMVNSSSGNTSDYVAGETYNLSGTLLTNWKPSATGGTFDRGTTYNTTNTNEPVYFIAQTDNGSKYVTLEGEFTVSELTNVQTGETVNSTTLDDNNVTTWNASLTPSQINELLAYDDKQREAGSTGGGGGSSGSGFNFNFGAAGFGFIAIVGGAALLLSNRS